MCANNKVLTDCSFAVLSGYISNNFKITESAVYDLQLADRINGSFYCDHNSPQVPIST